VFDSVSGRDSGCGGKGIATVALSLVIDGTDLALILPAETVICVASGTIRQGSLFLAVFSGLRPVVEHSVPFFSGPIRELVMCVVRRGLA